MFVLFKGRFGHYSQDRAISIREAARLQTFPDDFVFSNSLSDSALQIGNAVPIELVKASGEVFKMAIKSIKTSRAKKKVNNAESLWSDQTNTELLLFSQMFRSFPSAYAEPFISSALALAAFTIASSGSSFLGRPLPRGLSFLTCYSGAYILVVR